MMNIAEMNDKERKNYHRINRQIIDWFEENCYQGLMDIIESNIAIREKRIDEKDRLSDKIYRDVIAYLIKDRPTLYQSERDVLNYDDSYSFGYYLSSEYLPYGDTVLDRVRNYWRFEQEPLWKTLNHHEQYDAIYMTKNKLERLGVKDESLVFEEEFDGLSRMESEDEGIIHLTEDQFDKLIPFEVFKEMQFWMPLIKEKDDRLPF